MLGTILHLDSDHAARKARSALLRQAGFTVIEVALQVETLALAAECRPSAVLLIPNSDDPHAAGMCRALKACPATARIPLCVLDTGARQPAPAGSLADAHLREPLAPSSLAAALGMLCARSASGKARGAAASFLDISPKTFRAITEQDAVEHRVNLLAHAVESSDECISICDPQDRIIFVNRAFVRTYGYSEQELIGQPITIVGSPLNPPEATADILPTTLTGPWQGELWNRRKDGTDFPIQLTTSPVWDERGRLEATVALARDITVRRRRESALRDSQKQLQRVIDGSQLGFWEWDVPTGHLTFSSRWASMLGYRVEELESRYETWENLIHPDDRPAVLEALQDMLAGRRAMFEEDHRLRTRGGAWLWIQTRGKLVSRDSSRKPLLVSGTHTDISARKRMELIRAGRSRVMEQFSRAGTLDAILKALLRHAEDIFPGCPASILLLDQRRNRLHLGASQGLPEFYNQAVDGVEIGPQVGSCAAAAYLGRRVIAADLEDHPNWAPYLELTRKAGLRACWAEPIHSSSGAVLGTFAIYGRTPGVPSAEDLQLLQDAARLAGMVLERRRAEEALRQTEFELKRAQSVAHVGSWSLDVAEDRFVWSEETYRIFGKTPGTRLTYRVFLETVHPGDRELVHRSWTEALHCGRFGLEHRIVAGSEMKWVREDAEVEFDSLGRAKAIGTVQDITVRKLAELALQASRQALVENQEELRRLAAGLFRSQEDERRKISRELHDDLSQRLAMVAVQADLLEREVPPEALPARQRLQSLKSVAATLSDDVRRTAHQLHPSLIEHLGLVAALRSYAAHITEQGRLRVRFTHRQIPGQIPHETALCLYRIAQEALRNAEKHSGQDEASISLTGAKGELRLRVTDRGAGFHPAAVRAKGGLGIVGMEERVRWAGGSISITSQPGQGTRVEVQIPCPGGKS